MKTRKTVLALVLLLTGALVAESAFARHRGGPRISFGFGFGVPYYAYPSYPYYAPYYSYHPRYYPAPLVVERPPVYIEQQPAPQAPQVQQPQAEQPSNSWYYCHEAGAYYPYVKECPGGWQRVAPQPGN